ncbi:MAG: hypothetical protein DI613_06180 [Kocuria rhizophila]|nr:MAG: hypothetical protein DI613_06180 [Kocuria rhizophila]
MGLLAPAIGCTVFSQELDAFEALENASPENLADASSGVAAAALPLSDLEVIDDDIRPHVRHLLDIPST